MKVIKNIEQGTKEWHELRRCRVTATALEEVMGTPLARTQLIAELIAEEATEQSKVMRPTAEMERGSAEEIFAIKEFEKRYGKTVESVTICIDDERDWLAVSPDGLIENGGKYTEAVEVKSPDSKTGFFYRIANMIPLAPIPAGKKTFLGVPMDYKWQIVQSFIINKDLERLYFIVYDSRIIDDEHKLYVVEVERNNPLLSVAIADAERALSSFRDTWLEWKEIILPSKF